MRSMVERARARTPAGRGDDLGGRRAWRGEYSPGLAPSTALCAVPLPRFAGEDHPQLFLSLRLGLEAALRLAGAGAVAAG